VRVPAIAPVCSVARRASFSSRAPPVTTAARTLKQGGAVAEKDQSPEGKRVQPTAWDLMSFYCISDATVDPADAGSGTDIAVTVVSGVLDYESSPALKSHLMHQVKTSQRRLVVDLSDVTFIDSTTIGVLVGTSAKLSETRRSKLAVVCPEANWRVQRILEIARVETVLDVQASLEAALSAPDPAA